MADTTGTPVQLTTVQEVRDYMTKHGLTRMAVQDRTGSPVLVMTEAEQFDTIGEVALFDSDDAQNLGFISDMIGARAVIPSARLTDADDLVAEGIPGGWPLTPLVPELQA